MDSIIYFGNSTRKDGLGILGEGCRMCKSREKCKLGTCNLTQMYGYENATDLFNGYATYSTKYHFETVIKKYKHGYLLIVNGTQYLSGERVEGWIIHFYDRDRKSMKHSLSVCKEVYKGHRRCLEVSKNDAFNYGIPRYIRLISDAIILY